MMRSKAGIAVLSILLIAFVVWFISGFLTGGMWSMRWHIPRAVEVFEQSKDEFELIRNSGFATNNGWAINHPNSVEIAIRYGYGEESRGVNYSNWHTIEWLTEEEKNAIVSILTNEEWQLNVFNVSSEGARLYDRWPFSWGMFDEDAMLILFPGAEAWEVPFMTDSHMVDLGDGYRLWLYTARGPSIGAGFATAMQMILVVPIVILSVCLISAVSRYRKSRSKSN